MIVTPKLLDCNEMIVTHKLLDCNEMIVTPKLLSKTGWRKIGMEFLLKIGNQAGRLKGHKMKQFSSISSSKRTWLNCVTCWKNVRLILFKNVPSDFKKINTFFFLLLSCGQLYVVVFLKSGWWINRSLVAEIIQTTLYSRDNALLEGSLKQPRRRRQQKPHRFAYLTMKNSIFARFARAFFIFWHSRSFYDVK